MKLQSAIERAVDIVGGQTALAKKLGVKPQSVQAWVASGRTPPRRVLSVEEATAGMISRYELCPELYPPDSAGS